MKRKSFGSGYFGEWTEDSAGLPAYHYTCNQVKDLKAVTPVHPVFRIPTEHLHEVGNDRLVGVASNYGYIQVRQDEGSPKFLNEFDTSNHQYAGGFGYLTDGTETLSTFFKGQNEGFDRIFGTGYFRKTVTSKKYGVDQVVFAPFGDDPLLISQITITNHDIIPADLRWIEYWGCQMYQFSFRHVLLSYMEKSIGNAVRIRREFTKRFSRKLSRLENSKGLITEVRFKGEGLQKKIKWSLVKAFLTAKKMPVQLASKDISFEDKNPPHTFLISLDSPAQGMETDARVFFGKGGIHSPDGIKNQLAGKEPSKTENSAMILERSFNLKAGESKTLYFAYGYLPEGFDLETLAAKYSENYNGLFEKSCSAWKKDRIKLSIPDEPWVDRELLWHNYYLRGNLTYDSYFKEHVLCQGHVYQYILGFQGPARDTLQHALPFVFSQPWITKEILRLILKTVRTNGELNYSMTGYGMVMPAAFRPSDQELWLLWLASEYVLANRDISFLDETVKTYPDDKGKSTVERVITLLNRCCKHFMEATGTGEFGLQRLSNGDWNDGVVRDNVPKEDEENVRKVGVSVLNSAMASYVLDLYARMLKYTGHTDMADPVLEYADKQKLAVRAQWNEKWFRRAWLTPDIGWVGEEELWLEPQPWAIIGGAALPEQASILCKNIDERLRNPSPIGAMQMDKASRGCLTEPGVGGAGGIWPSLNGTLIWALSLVDGNLAWDEWKKNSLAAHAESYPDLWYGIWSGPDTYNSVRSTFPGHTPFDHSMITGMDPGYKDSYSTAGMSWTDFPVMNMHPHAWPLYTTAKLMGIEFTAEGVRLSPSLPKDEYSFESPLLGVKKSGDGYSGWYAPKVNGLWQIELRLGKEEAGKFSKITVNGIEKAADMEQQGRFIFTGEGSKEHQLYWEIR